MAAEEGMETDQDEILLHSDTKQRYAQSLFKISDTLVNTSHMHPLKHYFLFEIFSGFFDELSYFLHVNQKINPNYY